MQSKIPSKWLSFVIGTVGVISSAIIIYASIFMPGQGIFTRLDWLTRNQASPHLTAEHTQPLAEPGLGSPALPVRLRIPKIKVDAAVEFVGLTPDGAMDSPKGPVNVAWFNLGPRPGENGSAVIDGHFGWKGGVPAVFDNLHKLQKGDKLYVEDEKGVSITFVVRESRSYDPTANATEVFNSSDGKAHLNLITCEGVWDKAQNTYSQRLIVFTDKE